MPEDPKGGGRRSLTPEDWLLQGFSPFLGLLESQNCSPEKSQATATLHRFQDLPQRDPPRTQEENPNFIGKRKGESPKTVRQAELSSSEVRGSQRGEGGPSTLTFLPSPGPAGLPTDAQLHTHTPLLTLQSITKLTHGGRTPLKHLWTDSLQSEE